VKAKARSMRDCSQDHQDPHRVYNPRAMLPIKPVLAVLAAAAASVPLHFTGSAELVEKGRVSTESSEVRIAFSPDGARMLWGTTSRAGGPGGWDIWECRREGAGWSDPQAVGFGSPQNDFDPFVAADGVYFFSNRPGGLGGDDLYFAPFDAARGTYGAARNLGAVVNTASDEWAPTLSADGATLLFASDGHGGVGLHDFFTSRRRGEGWAEPVPVKALNSRLDDFDAAFLHDGRSVVFARRGRDEDGASLFVSLWRNGAYTPPRKLGPEVNEPEAWNIGPAVNAQEPGVLYFSSARPGAAAGRMDVYRIKYQAAK
jgi:hypothetical protein